MRVSRAFQVAAIATSLLSLPALLCAQDDKSKSDKAASADTAKPAPTEVTTTGTISVGGQQISYNSIAGTITVGATDIEDAQLGPDGKPEPGSPLALNAPEKPKDAPPTARMFYVAYFKKDAKAEDRPITFFYNGGPGSSTVWLHMGSLGPKHVPTPGDQHLPAAPYKLADNPYTLLDTSDLVFIDMPGTGFGRLLGKDPEKAFWGVDEDGNAFARFIQRFITKYNMWNSPKFIFGESYGTTRSSVLVDILENGHSLDINGVILLSQIFNFTTDIDGPSGNPGVDLPYTLGLPTYAATAWYHKKVPSACGAGTIFEGSGRFCSGALSARAGSWNRYNAGREAGCGGETAQLYRDTGGVLGEGESARERRAV